MAKLKDVIKLTAAQYDELYTNRNDPSYPGITKDGITYKYDANTVYLIVDADAYVTEADLAQIIHFI